jgi:hypothetical protein
MRLFGLVPLIFGLLPASTLEPRQLVPDFKPVKPAIREHLTRLGIPIAEPLLSLLKAVADQYSGTHVGSRNRRRKNTVADLRALRTPYARLRIEQNSRCAVCGVGLHEDTEHLDHIVPWRLIGDVPDGANWRLLCAPCNLGKGAFISTLQSPAAYNWIYSVDQSQLTSLRAQTRWIVLVQRGRCELCGALPSDAELLVEALSIDMAPVADLLTVRCAHHDGSCVA